MCDCDCFDNPAEFFRAESPVARKAHKCCECLRIIQPGERYERAMGLWSGDFETFKTCELCLKVREVAGLKCWCYGQLIDDVYCDVDYLGPEVEDFVQRRRENWNRRKLEEVKR